MVFHFHYQLLKWKRREICRRTAARYFKSRKKRDVRMIFGLLLAAEIFYGVRYMSWLQKTAAAVDSLVETGTEQEVWLSEEKQEREIFGFSIRWEEGTVYIYKVKEQSDGLER